MLEKYDLFVVQHKILQYIRSVAPKVKNTFIDKAQTATIKKFYESCAFLKQTHESYNKTPNDNVNNINSDKNVDRKS